jgi:hypothetical protein
MGRKINRPCNTSPERLWRDTAVNPTTACWEWLGVRENGYGRIRWLGKMVATHRLAWALTHGPVPPGMVVCHRCDVRQCCNPDHLFVGSVSDNAQDMVRKGRHPDRTGERHPLAKLTNSAISEMRSLAGMGVRQCDIARKFAADPSMVSKILRGLAWRTT